MPSTNSLLIPLLKSEDFRVIVNNIVVTNPLPKMPKEVLFLIMDYLEIVNAYALGNEILKDYCGGSNELVLKENLNKIALFELMTHPDFKDGLLSALCTTADSYTAELEEKRKRKIKRQDALSVLSVIAGIASMAFGIYGLSIWGKEADSYSPVEGMGVCMLYILAIAAGIASCTGLPCKKYPKEMTETQMLNMPFSKLPPIPESIDNSSLYNKILNLFQVNTPTLKMMYEKVKNYSSENAHTNATHSCMYYKRTAKHDVTIEVIDDAKDHSENIKLASPG